LPFAAGNGQLTMVASNSKDRSSASSEGFKPSCFCRILLRRFAFGESGRSVTNSIGCRRRVMVMIPFRLVAVPPGLTVSHRNANWPLTSPDMRQRFFLVTTLACPGTVRPLNVRSISKLSRSIRRIPFPRSFASSASTTTLSTRSFSLPCLTSSANLSASTTDPLKISLRFLRPKSHRQ